MLIPYIFFTKDLDHPSLFEVRSNPEVQQAPAHEKYAAVRDDLLGKQAKGDKKVEGMAAVSVGTLGRKFGILVADLLHWATQPKAAHLGESQEFSDVHASK